MSQYFKGHHSTTIFDRLNKKNLWGNVCVCIIHMGNIMLCFKLRRVKVL